ncbi:MAG: radical SAM protein [Candidatus Aminicenantes bacterium]|nr:radical SAM protein [Candidatus Aminicenantes bacterium]
MNWKQSETELKCVMGIFHGSRAFGGPLQADLGLTNRCGLQCLHCFYYSPHTDKPNLKPLLRAKKRDSELPSQKSLTDLLNLDANTDRTNKLIDELISMGTCRFEFIGGGEPFLHDNALEFMARAKHAGGTCLVNTSGYLFDKDKMDALLKMGFDVLRITTMAGTRDMYIRTHPKAKKSTFDDIENNLNYLAERKKASGRRYPKIELICVVMSENIDGLKDFAEFAVRMNADALQYRAFADVDDPGLAGLVPSKAQSSSARKALADIKPYLDSHRLKHNIDHFMKITRRQLDTTALYHIIPCCYGWAATRILPDGNVYPCCKCYDSMGNVNDTDFRDIWYGETYRRFRKAAGRINKHDFEVSGCSCYSCSHHAANLRIFRALHPIKKRAKRLQRLATMGLE